MRSSSGSDSRASRASTFAVVTLGCKVNQYESQAIREMLQGAGLTEADPLSGPDIFVLNSCGVTLRSSSESRRWINRVRRRSPQTTIVATGCSSEIDPDVLQGADLVVSQPDKHSLPRMLGFPTSGHRCTRNIDMAISRFASRTRAFLRIQDGCSRKCSFCAVPLARGTSVSRDPDAVLDEARRLSDAAYPEIVLCGVDLGSYGADFRPRVHLASLLDHLLRLPGETRFRISSIDINDVTDDLLSLVSSNDRLCPHLHIPLQSGDPEILRRMRRRYTPDIFLSRIDALRAAVDRPAITTDCMVGFPGETDAAFGNTISVVRAARFSRIHAFRFSPRPGTSARELPEQLPDNVLSERITTLIAEGRRLSQDYRGSLLGDPAAGIAPRPLDVVIERTNDTGCAGLAGRYVRVTLRAACSPGTRLPALPTALDGSSVAATAPFRKSPEGGCGQSPFHHV